MLENLDWCNIFLALAGKTCYYMAYKFQYTYTPFLTASFNISEDKWISSQTITETAMLITSPMAILFDKMAPNKVMGWGLAIPFLSMFLLPLGIQQFGIPSYPWIIANRAVFGFGSGLWVTAIAGILGDFTPEKSRGRAFGIVEFSWTLSDFFIPLIGISLQYCPVNVVYYVQGVVALIIAMGLLWRFPRRAKRAVSPRVSRGVESETLVSSTVLSSVGRLDQVVPWHPFSAVESNEQSYELLEDPQRSSVDSQKPSMRFLLLKPSSIGTLLLGLLSSGFMISFSYYGIWLESDHEFTSDEVGAAYFISYTIPGVIVLIWSIFFSDRVGLIRSAYLSVLLFVLPIGLIFTFLNKSIPTTGSIWLICLFTIGTEGLFVTFTGYLTMAEFCSNPMVMSALWRTAFSLGKTCWISVSPILWDSFGKLLTHSAVTNQFGLMVATTTLLFALGIICLTIGRRYEKHVHDDE